MCLYVCVCVCVCVCVYGLCVYLVWCSSHPHPPHTHRRTPTPITKKTVIHPPPHTETHTHPCTNTHIPSTKANSPPLDPHPHTARPHTLIRTWTTDVSRLNVLGGDSMCVCMRMVCADACMWVGVSMCSWVCGLNCVCLCVRACSCEVREGCACVCVRLVRICAWFGASHILTDSRTCTPPPNTHPHAISGIKPPCHPTHTHTLPSHTYAHTPA